MLAIQVLILGLTTAFFVGALVWILSVLRKQKRLLVRNVVTPNGIQRRINFDLIEDISVYLATFVSSIFLAQNFVAYTITGSWAFGDYIGKASVVMIIISGV